MVSLSQYLIVHTHPSGEDVRTQCLGEGMEWGEWRRLLLAFWHHQGEDHVSDPQLTVGNWHLRRQNHREGGAGTAVCFNASRGQSWHPFNWEQSSNWPCFPSMDASIMTPTLGPHDNHGVYKPHWWCQSLLGYKTYGRPLWLDHVVKIWGNQSYTPSF